MGIRFSRWVWVFCTVALIFLNVATVLNARVYDFIHDAFSTFPYESLVSHSKSTQLASLKKENLKLSRQNREFESIKKASKNNLLKAKAISKRISRRVVKNISLNTSSVVGESIPYLGIAVILSVTALDIYDGCQTIKDTNDLLYMLEETPDLESEVEVCGFTLPSIEEIESQLLDYQNNAKSALSG